MSDIESQRTAIADQPAADDYPTLQQRYPTAEPLFFTCMCGPFASILSAAVASESLVADVNSHFASGREPIGDPPPDDGADGAQTAWLRAAAHRALNRRRRPT